MPCAIPPLDQSEVAVGRGYGRGYNRERTSRDQLHAGMDFVASTGAPVLAPFPGVVDFVSTDTGPRINPDAARAGTRGQVRRMGGYGNSVVLRHDVAVPGLPTPFFTSYNHLSAFASGIAPGVAVETGRLLGQVGQTTNGQFPGMGAHLHMELRRVAFPGSYERDTMDPSLLFTALGIDWIGGRTEVERRVGGQLFIRADGPSGPATCPRTTSGLAGGGRSRGALWLVATAPGIPGIPFLGLDGLNDYLGAGVFGFGVVTPPGYVDPTRLKPSYTSRGNTQMPRIGTPAADVMPPDYTAVIESAASSGSRAVAGVDRSLLIGAGIAAIFVGAKLLRNK